MLSIFRNSSQRAALLQNPVVARYENGLLVFLLVAVSALVYLPRLHQIGYLNDDWYLMYSAHAYGPQVFHDIFSVDRPARAMVLKPAYTLFGDNPFYYNLSAYVFRLISGISFLWLLKMLWPQQHKATFMAALLFLLYPGFLSQINGIDYQSQIVSLAAGMLSIALSVMASLHQKPPGKWVLFTIATLLGWFYLGLVEYFLGLEILRFASLYLLASRTRVSWKGAPAGLRNALPGLVVPVCFLVWRLFFFESERSATDVGSQLTVFGESPLATTTWWLVRLVSNVFYVLFLAWGIPLYQFLSFISGLRELFFTSIVVAVVLSLLFWLIRPWEETPEQEARDWRLEALFLGLVTAFAGLVPVILVNRQADFGDFSRYTLASSAGSALVLVAILFFLSSRAVRGGLFAALVAVAVFTHHANAIRVVNETRSMRSFWWQVAWRIPQLKPDTTLVVNYPITAIQEDYFVWGPANLIYYPEGVDDDQMRVTISAVVLNKDSLLKILSKHGRERENRRFIRSVTDYQRIVVLSMPSQGSCVQVLDGNQPQISPFEEDRIMLIAPYSDTTRIDLDAEPHVPPPLVFGPEPVHDWCYYFQKADLARQRGDWNEVLRLGAEIRNQNLVPADEIEWMPFLHAYARAGDVESLDRIRRLMKNAEAYVTQQVCQLVGTVPHLPDSGKNAIDSFYCHQ